MEQVLILMQDEKCRACGHNGRTIIFPGADDRHPPPATFHTIRFDTKTEPRELSYGNWRLVSASGRKPEVAEEDEHDDGVTRHIMGFLGDAPVSYARWRLVPACALDGGEPTDELVAVVDRLLTSKEYRRRGYGRGILAFCFADILQAMMEMRMNIVRVSMFIPIQADCVAAAQTAVTCGLQTHGPARAEDPTFTAMPEYISEAGIQEFTIAAQNLTNAYECVVNNAKSEGLDS